MKKIIVTFLEIAVLPLIAFHLWILLSVMADVISN